MARRSLLLTQQQIKWKQGVHKNESNYCPRLVNWSVLDVKKLYFLFEAILEPLLQSLPGSVVVSHTKGRVRSAFRHGTLAGQDCLHALVHRSHQGASRVQLYITSRAAATSLSCRATHWHLQLATWWTHSVGLPQPPRKILELAFLREVENVPLLIRPSLFLEF